MRATRRSRKSRNVYPEKLPSYLLPPVPRRVVFDPTLRRAGDLIR